MYTSILEACRKDLYSSESELLAAYPKPVAEGVMRVREMYHWTLANPALPDRKFIEECVMRHDISRPTAYKILRVVKTLLPLVAQTSREYHRWRYNEMILATYEVSRKRGDGRTMERAASSYARYNSVDKEEEKKVPVDEIKVQPFTATDDPSVLGLKRIPNIRSRVQELINKYSREISDIEEVSYEEADLQIEEIFNPEITVQESEPESELTF